MKSRNAIFCLIGAGALALSAAPAFAITTSDFLLYYNGNTVVDSATASEEGEADVPSQLYVLNNPVPINPVLIGHPYYVTDGLNGPISDIFGIVFVGNGNYSLAFMSDPVNIPFAEEAFGSQDGWVFRGVETGGQTLDADPFLDQALVANGTIDATFTSDGDTVPDGGLTLSLLGFALAGIEGLRRKLGR